MRLLEDNVSHVIVSSRARPARTKETVSASRADSAVTAIGANHVFWRSTGSEADAHSVCEVGMVQRFAFVGGGCPKPFVATVWAR